MKRRIMISSIALFILALGFNAVLNLNALHEFVEKSVLSQYQIIGQDLQQGFKTSPYIGNDFINSPLLEQVLNKTKHNLLIKKISKEDVDAGSKNFSSNISVSLASKNGIILWSTDDSLRQKKVPQKAWMDYPLSVVAGKNVIESHQAQSDNMLHRLPG